MKRMVEIKLEFDCPDTFTLYEVTEWIKIINNYERELTNPLNGKVKSNVIYLGHHPFKG
jgi:hypothetical protein